VLTARTETVRADSERRALFSSTAERAPLLGAAAAAGAGAAGAAGPSGGGPFGGGPMGAGGAFGGAGGGLGLGGPAAAGGGIAGASPPGPPPPSAAALFGGGGGGGAPGGGGGGYLQQQLALAPQQQDGYLSSRAEALHNVETTIVELGTIFTQLAEMVHAQGEMTRRIDENVDEALGNVDAAKAQLMRYLATVSTNRWLVMKVFGVLLAFVLFFVLFVA